MSNQSWQLMASATFRHLYYNASGEICPDVAVEPTAYTQQQLRAHGLRLRTLPGGVSVYYQADAGYTPPDPADPKALSKPWTGALRLTLALWLTNPRLLRVTQSPVPNVRNRELWRIAEGDAWTVYTGRSGSFRYAYEHATATLGHVYVLDENNAPVTDFAATQVGENADATANLLEAKIDLSNFPPGLYTLEAMAGGATVQTDTYYVVPQSGSQLPIGVMELNLNLEAAGDYWVPPSPLPSWAWERDAAKVPWRYEVTLSRSFDRYDAMRVKDSATPDPATGLADLDGESEEERPAPSPDTATTTQYPLTYIKLMTENPSYEADERLVFESVATAADLDEPSPVMAEYEVYETPHDRLQLEGRVAGPGNPNERIWEILKDKLPNPPLGRASLDIHISL